MLCISPKKYYFCIIKRITLILVLAFLTLSANAQFTDSTTGLLQCPSADMNESGTFTITNNYLNQHLLPEAGWDYSTFGYGFGVTFWSRLEINYICTLLWGDWSPHAQGPEGTYREKIMKNQDRHFAAKVLLLKEGEIWGWTPSIAVGISDPVSSNRGNYEESATAGSGYFNRFYVAVTKHFHTQWGEVSGTIGYQYNKNVPKFYHYNAPCAAVTWRPVWLRNRWFDPKFILEYDARTPNFGFIADIWDSRFQAMFELQNFRWVSFGLRFKLRLKGSE